MRLFVVALLLSCQLSFVAAFESFSVAANEIHQVLSHNEAIDHHHHDAFTTHFDHETADSTHQHFTDSFQSPALLASRGLLSAFPTASPPTAFNPIEPPAVFIDGLLRPPRFRV
ncbi:MAG: hypothetical protein NBV66_04970 [Burkholderiaceae bacterium]|nr:hypothetical protein [Burkholderiaceae bacterium]